MIAALTMLLGCQLAGEALARLAGVPVPGPVIGLALLFVALIVRDRIKGAPLPDDAPLARTATGILANLSLLFVPAGTGIVQQAGVLIHNGVGLIVALVISTALTLAVTALVFAAVARRLDPAGSGSGSET